MDRKKMFRPERLIPGKAYRLILKTEKRGEPSKENVQTVIFRCYRPHPAEVVVKILDEFEVVARKNIFLESV